MLLAPHVTEKTARVAEEGNQFAFRVRRTRPSPTSRQAVELMFDVKVSRAGAEQPARAGASAPSRASAQDYKKAYVRLAAGQTIDFTGRRRKA